MPSSESVKKAEDDLKTIAWVKYSNNYKGCVTTILLCNPNEDGAIPVCRLSELDQARQEGRREVIAREQSLKERQREVFEKIKEPLESMARGLESAKGKSYGASDFIVIDALVGIQGTLSIINSELKDRGGRREDKT